MTTFWFVATTVAVGVTILLGGISLWATMHWIDHIDKPTTARKDNAKKAKAAVPAK